MSIVRFVLAGALFALGGCMDGAVSSAAYEPGAPSREIRRAIEVWERGADAIPRKPVRRNASADTLGDGWFSVSTGTEPSVPFSGFDEFVRDFLESPLLRSAVQYGCTDMHAGEEQWVERGLVSADELEQVRALVVLIRVRAPRSVAAQWAALERLSAGPRAVEFSPVTTRLRAAFAPEAISHALRESLPANSAGVTPGYEWWVRAAGVTRHRGVLPRLVELVRTGPLDAALAAGRSLEEFDDPEGDAALAACAVGLPNEFAVRAAWALMSRDRERLRAILLESSPPERTLRDKGRLLAGLDDRRGVPLLCETVPRRSIIDRTMFDAIERLAGPEDLAAVEALPVRVRDEQRVRADEVVATVRERFGRAR